MTGIYDITFLKDRKIAVTAERGVVVSVKAVEKRPGVYRVEVDDEGKDGAFQCVVTVRYGDGGFSFKPVDVKSGYPMVYVEEGVAVCVAGEKVSADKFAARTKKATRQATYRDALRDTGGIQSCPTVLAAELDARTFEFGFRKYPIEEKQHYDLYDYVVPHYCWHKAGAPDLGVESIVYRYLLGRGIGCRNRIKRRLYKGYLPILTASIADGDVGYDLTAFVTTEKGVNGSDGTDYLLADSHSAAAVFTDEQSERIKTLSFPEEAPFAEMRVEVTNRSAVPALAFVRAPHVNTFVMAETKTVDGQTFDGEKGYGKIGDKVYLVAFQDGMPCPAIETCVTVYPGEKRTYRWILFHTPVSETVAARIAKGGFGERLEEAADHYESVLEKAASIKTPERRMNEIWKASYLGMRNNCFGRRGSDVYAAEIGVYCSIATEGENVISALAANGDFEYAKKCTGYFFAKQREDGFIQDMYKYMSETGAALWLAREIYGFTHDEEWLVSVSGGIKKAADYLLKQIAESEEKGGVGKGLVSGQVADPEDNYRLYMLNAIAYGGLVGAGKTLSAAGDASARKYTAAAEELKADIVAAIRENLVTSPLVPAEDGTFVPALPAWAEAKGAAYEHLGGEVVVTHGTVCAKDGMLSSQHLFRYGVLSPSSREGRLIMKSQRIMLDRSTGFSQPYYGAMAYAELVGGDIDRFVEEFYYALAALSDRETYTFWEHIFLATPNKTSEQGGFIGRFRAILAYEDVFSGRLVVLKGMPECWKRAKDNSVEVKGLGTAFGKLSYRMRRAGGDNYEFAYECDRSDTEIEFYPPFAEGPVILRGGKGVYEWKAKQAPRS